MKVLIVYHTLYGHTLQLARAVEAGVKSVPGVEALSGTVSTAAWRSKPSWYLVVTDDKMIPPPAQRSMSKRAGSTVVEVPGSHAIYVSQPAAVADLIKTASKGVSKKAGS